MLAHQPLPLEQGLFQYLDIILFVEATIYQMDEDNEALCEQLAEEAAASGSNNSQLIEHHTFPGGYVKWGQVSGWESVRRLVSKGYKLKFFTLVSVI